MDSPLSIAHFRQFHISIKWLNGTPLNDATLARFIKAMTEADDQYSLSAIRMVVAAVNKQA